jgi:hypothetical protein
VIHSSVVEVLAIHSSVVEVLAVISGKIVVRTHLISLTYLDNFTLQENTKTIV